jgi:hypothetical protein
MMAHPLVFPWYGPVKNPVLTPLTLTLSRRERGKNGHG